MQGNSGPLVQKQEKNFFLSSVGSVLTHRVFLNLLFNVMPSRHGETWVSTTLRAFWDAAPTPTLHVFAPRPLLRALQLTG